MIAKSRMWTTDTKLLHSSFVILFQTRTAASFSFIICFRRFLPSVYSLMGKMHAQKGLSLETDLATLKPLTSFHWWTLWLFWQHVFGCCHAALGRVSRFILAASLFKLEDKKTSVLWNNFTAVIKFISWVKINELLPKACKPKPQYCLRCVSHKNLCAWDHFQILSFCTLPFTPALWMLLVVSLDSCFRVFPL